MRHRQIVGAEEGGWLQVQGHQRQAEGFVGGPRTERQTVRHEERGVARGLLSQHADDLRRMAPRRAADHAESAAGMPDVRVAEDLVVVLDRAERDDRQADPFEERREIGVGDDRDVVAATPQRERDADMGMHVAGAPDRDHDDAHRCVDRTAPRSAAGHRWVTSANARRSSIR